MRIFVTGASGYIGSSLVSELLGAGHEVLGLVRSDAAAEAIAASGADVQRGSLDDLDSLAAGARASDGVAHLAYMHGASDTERVKRADRQAIDTLAAALAGSGKPLVVTSGTLALAPGRIGHEADSPDPSALGAARIVGEQAARAAAGRGVRASIVRLAPSVHGDRDPGFVPALIAAARAAGVAGYVGDGANRWPAVHRLDAVRLFRLALEQAPAGSVLHGVADEGVPLKRIAEVIARHLDIPTASLSRDEAAEQIGSFLAAAVSTDAPASSAATRQLLGWQPAHPGLIRDLETGHYFDQITP